MASNYEAICEENRKSYGTKGAQKSGKLAAGLYDDRTHFIFELLQNAEDALGRRGEWSGSCKVTFTLSSTRLTLSHFGKPFDEADVRSICDIAESTKNESSIGRFGLGFKSVYTITDLPEVHSGDENFAIENYVFPRRLERSTREADETQIILPLKREDREAAQDITTGLRQLGPGALLFLRHIDEIEWSVEGGPSGFYLRTTPEALGHNVNRVTVIGQESGRSEIDQNWLVFHRDVFSDKGTVAGRVEIAFSLEAVGGDPGRWAVQPLSRSRIVVFFPTVVESHLGFLVQGPYRTTPSRDNILPGDPWNQHLVKETSNLLAEALRWMRNESMLDVSVLRCLPFDREKFPTDSRFAPMFDVVKKAFEEEALLPTFDGKYVSANQAKLARTQELRELFSPSQLAALFGAEIIAWLSDDITEVKTPEIRRYLMRELHIDEIRPEKVISSLNKAFLEAQSDEWISRLYEFLNSQGKLVRAQLEAIPLIRLEDGSHVVAQEDEKYNAFLPSAITTSFPTVRRAVCANHDARAFLISLGITEPDPVDDVIWNVLPKYKQAKAPANLNIYVADIERIRTAFNTDSTFQKEKLRSALRDAYFVMAIDTGSRKSCVSTPESVYIATDRLQQLFTDVPGILIVDNEYDCLRGEDIRDLLVSCGASRYLSPEAAPSHLEDSEKTTIRREAGLERASWQSTPEDFTLRGLAELLHFLPTLERTEVMARSKLIWEALTDLESRGHAAFYGTYRWGYYQETKSARFDAAFVKTLNKVAWVPNVGGELVPPGLVEFDTLGWKSNPFLQTKIAFKPPMIDQLAKEAGIDPAILDLLRRDPSLVAELTSRLSVNPTPNPQLPSTPAPENNKPNGGDVYEGAGDLYGEDMPEIPPGTPDPDGGDDYGKGTGRGGQSRSRTETSHRPGQSDNSAGSGSGSHGSGKDGSQGKRTPGHAGARPFISYIGTHPDDDGTDPDGLDQAQRMRIEAEAIDLIIRLEPSLSRTPVGNPGFDLFEANNDGKQTRWVEVKSMTGTLNDRPVGLSRTQFDLAREKGEAYWL